MSRLAEIQRELERLHRDTGKLFSVTASRMDELLSEPDLNTWAELCSEIAGSGWHAWESCSEYLRISPALARHGGSAELLRSGRYGVSLCGYSFEPCHAYFKGFGELVDKDALASALPVEDAGAVVKARYTHASTLIADYFRAAWQVADDRALEEVGHWSAIAARIAQGERADLERFLAASGRVGGVVSWQFISVLHDESRSTGIGYLDHFPSLRRYLDQATLEV
ncbi:MAG: hypothetical protein HUJ31_18800, partial [Pseudomonadales bacterium]|nr:hypothetical protein [Pseudomonadales bacterium]